MSGGVIALIIVGVIAGLGIIFAIWLVATYNSFIKIRNNVDEAFSTMDIYLKKRYDVIPNLVETIKGFTKHESETLEGVMRARYDAMNATGAEKIKKENALSSTLKSLFKVTENYPDLKSDKHYSELMRTLNEIEAELVSARKYYNGNVKLYNTKREVFPSSIIAKWFKFEKRDLFEVEAPEERKNVKVQF